MTKFRRLTLDFAVLILVNVKANILNVSLLESSTYINGNFTDITEDSIGSCEIIKEIQKQELPAVRKVLESIFLKFRDLETRWEKKRKIREHASKLTPDETVVHLYTIEYGSPTSSLYREVNTILRSTIAQRENELYSYVRLLLEILPKNEVYEGPAFCGSRSDLSHQYRKGEAFSWRTYSVWTNDVGKIEQMEGIKMIFCVENCRGILLPCDSGDTTTIVLQPNTSFKVKKTRVENLERHGVVIVYLEQSIRRTKSSSLLHVPTLSSDELQTRRQGKLLIFL